MMGPLATSEAQIHAIAQALDTVAGGVERLAAAVMAERTSDPSQRALLLQTLAPFRAATDRMNAALERATAAITEGDAKA